MERLRPLAPGVAWVAAPNFHLTLKFLGPVEAPRLGPVTAALAGVLGARPTFRLTLGGLGAFPSAARPRVLWAGIDQGAGAAADLAADIEAALVPLGFEPESRPFSAHVTLGRVRLPRADRRLAEALATGRPAAGQHVGRVSLMRSDLSPRGARYTELAALPLALEPGR